MTELHDTAQSAERARRLEPLDSLTPRGRARRLRGVALQALEHYDLDVTRVRLITNDFNGIFRVDVATGHKYILRVAIPDHGHPPGQFRSEMMWLDALSRHTDLSVPKPEPTRAGAFTVAVSTEGVPKPRQCMVFGWVPGVNLGDRLNETNVEMQGELMAGMHVYSERYRAPADFKIYRYDNLFHFPEPVQVWDPAFEHVVPPERAEIFRRTQVWTERVIADLQACGEPMRVLHGDLHQWNVRVYRDLVSPIDFEDIIWGWPVQDIGIALYYYKANEQYESLRAAFRRGYERVCPWPERSPEQVDAFIASRGLGLLNTIMASSNPEWIEAMPGFAERTEKRVTDLMRAHDIA